MMRQTFFMATFFLVATFSVNAGTITNGVWISLSCGAEPVPPAVVTTNIEAYNLSIKAINDWQTAAGTYNACLIKDANADVAVITKAANEAQARLQAAIEKIKVETAAAAAKLGGK